MQGKGYARRYYSNFSYFREIDSKDKAYFLGFIASDGCVYDRDNGIQQKMLSIGIHQKDEEVLTGFLKYLDSNNPINKHFTKETPVAQIQIVNDELCNDLSKYNIFPRKTWEYYPKNIPNEFMWHFIRGYFDGDGYISWKKESQPNKCNISFCGNGKTMKFLSEVLNNYKIDNCLIRDQRKKYKDKFYNLYINNIKSKILFIRYLYIESDNLALSRKKQLCLDFISVVKRKYNYLEEIN